MQSEEEDEEDVDEEAKEEEEECNSSIVLVSERECSKFKDLRRKRKRAKWILMKRFPSSVKDSAKAGENNHYTQLHGTARNNA
jgi:hypothetical protein